MLIVRAWQFGEDASFAIPSHQGRTPPDRQSRCPRLPPATHVTSNTSPFAIAIRVRVHPSRFPTGNPLLVECVLFFCPEFRDSRPLPGFAVLRDDRTAPRQRQPPRDYTLSDSSKDSRSTARWSAFHGPRRWPTACSHAANPYLGGISQNGHSPPNTPSVLRTTAHGTRSCTRFPRASDRHA